MTDKPPQTVSEREEIALAERLYLGFWDRNGWSGANVTPFADQSPALHAMWIGIATDSLALQAEGRRELVKECGAVLRDLFEQWPEDSAPSGPLCLRAAAIINMTDPPNVETGGSE